jgi:hypothetical protein
LHVRVVDSNSSSNNSDKKMPTWWVARDSESLVVHKGRQAVLILKQEIFSAKWEGRDCAGDDTTQAKFIRQLMQVASTYVASLMPEDEVSFLQIRSKNHQEIMIATHGILF